MSDTSSRTHHRVCHLCEAMYGLVIQTEGDNVADIRGDKDDPLRRGHVCPKAVALQDIHEDPDRLRKPMKRIRSAPGDYQHVEIEWPEALDLAANALASTIEKQGVDAVGAYLGNPSVHNYGMLTHQRNLSDIRRFVRDGNVASDHYRQIGRRHVRDNNSWMHNHHRLMMKGKSRCQLLMHPDDVAKEGWQSGMFVTIQSRVGEVDAELVASDEKMPGVVSLPHGYGHGLAGTRGEVASRHAGVSCNDITDDQFVDQLPGNAAVNGVSVQLSAAAA